MTGALEDVAAPSRVTKSVQFDRDELAELAELEKEFRRRSFSDTVAFAVRHGIKRIAELKAEGKLVA